MRRHKYIIYFYVFFYLYTHIIKSNNQQKITGIVVNEKAQTSATYRKKIRQEIYYIKKYGLSSHLRKIQSSFSKKEYLNKIKDNLDIENIAMTYDYIVKRLGVPKEVVIDYYEQENMYDLIKRAIFTKILKIFLIIFLVITSMFFAYKSYIYQNEYEEIKNSSNGYFEEVKE